MEAAEKQKRKENKSGRKTKAEGKQKRIKKLYAPPKGRVQFFQKLLSNSFLQYYSSTVFYSLTVLYVGGAAFVCAADGCSDLSAKAQVEGSVRVLLVGLGPEEIDQAEGQGSEDLPAEEGEVKDKGVPSLAVHHLF